MEVRITYRSEIYIKGENLDDIKEKFESVSLDPNFSNDRFVTDFGFIEVVSAEDADNYNDLTNEFI